MSFITLIRSIIFNILFYIHTTIVCTLFIPAFFVPRGASVWVTHLWVGGVKILEKYILGLTFEVRGAQYLPTNNKYIVAAKHQSAYETLKLHHLFGDPTIVLKKELLSIPLFGNFLKKLDVIAIDRSNKETSISSIIDGARRMGENGRPIVIFPQGTRVAYNKSKPYKGGIAKMYQATDLPIIPLALNSGLFWPKNSFIKQPGKVIFEFLPPIESGLPDKKIVKALEDRIEDKTNQLMLEAITDYPYLLPPKQQELLENHISSKDDKK